MSYRLTESMFKPPTLAAYPERIGFATTGQVVQPHSTSE
jgi:hypothetical protein